MAQVQLRFYEELNDFLPPALRKTTITHDLTRRASVKDVIESFGVPHTEVELILANGRSVDFSYIVQAGDRISVYPMFEALDISPLIRLREKPLREPRFIIDANLGRLARYLRLLGFDTLYRNNYPDQEIAHIAQRRQTYRSDPRPRPVAAQVDHTWLLRAQRQAARAGQRNPRATGLIRSRTPLHALYAL